MKTNIISLMTLLFILLIAGCKNDDDRIVVIASVEISTNVSNASETGDNGFFTLRLTERINDDLQVNYESTGAAVNGVDFELIEGTVTIPANTLSAKITIQAFDDEVDEETENVIITLLNTNNEAVVIGDQKTASITIEDAPNMAEILLAETRFNMVNQNATDETVALYYNLKTIAASQFIVGQQDAFDRFFENNVGASDIRKSTGSDPGLLGVDFMFITDDENNGSPSNWFFQQEKKIMEDVVEAYDKGMINTFVWHFREPYEGEYFDVGPLSDFQKQNAFNSILPGGENHEYYKQKLNKIAEVSQNLIGSDGKLIPIIFRPFHEFDGDWFWWGAAYTSPDSFIELWKFTIDYLIDNREVNNMIFAYSPDNKFMSETDYLIRYPGDEYVDVFGMDNYGDFIDEGEVALENANQKLGIISSLAITKNKVAALTETCYFVTPGTNSPIPNFYSERLFNTLTDNDIEISYMMFWSNSENSYCTPTPGQSSLDDFMNFIGKPETLLVDELPNMYTIVPPNS